MKSAVKLKVISSVLLTEKEILYLESFLEKNLPYRSVSRIDNKAIRVNKKMVEALKNRENHDYKLHIETPSDGNYYVNNYYNYLGKFKDALPF